MKKQKYGKSDCQAALLQPDTVKIKGISMQNLQWDRAEQENEQFKLKRGARESSSISITYNQAGVLKIRLPFRLAMLASHARDQIGRPDKIFTDVGDYSSDGAPTRKTVVYMDPVDGDMLIIEEWEVPETAVPSIIEAPIGIRANSKLTDSV